jgi:hypothetical protein
MAGGYLDLDLPIEGILEGNANAFRSLVGARNV